MLSSRLLLPTSRLWLPGMSLNPLGRFGVCADDPCEEEPVCSFCNPIPSSFEVTGHSIVNDGCDCSSLNTTFVCDYVGYFATQHWSTQCGAHCLYRYTFDPPLCAGLIVVMDVAVNSSDVALVLGDGVDYDGFQAYYGWNYTSPDCEITDELMMRKSYRLSTTCQWLTTSWTITSVA